MKVLGLIEQDLDVVSKEYVDNKIKEVAKTGDNTPEGKVSILPVVLWAALRGRGIGITTKEGLYKQIFLEMEDFITKDGKTPVRDFQSGGEVLTKDSVGLDTLILNSPDLYADTVFYSTGVDYIINAILSSGSREVKNPNLKGHVGLDLISLIMFFPSEEQCKAIGITCEELASMFISGAVDSEGKNISIKHEYTTLTIEKLSEIAETDPVVYVSRGTFLSLMSDMKNATTSNKGDTQAIENMMKFYEAHKDDPKIKIVTPNEYKINRKDPDTLYIVKES